MPFSNFPDAAYLRVFAFDRALTKEEIASVGGVIEPFLLTWKAHGLVIPSAWSLQEGQVLLFAADTTQVPMKGCSGDSLFGLLAELETAVGVNIPPMPPVVYRSDDGLACIERSQFSGLVQGGAVDADTAVIDLTLSTVGALRSRGLEMPARDCWHSKAWSALAS